MDMRRFFDARHSAYALITLVGAIGATAIYAQPPTYLIELTVTVRSDGGGDIQSRATVPLASMLGLITCSRQTNLAAGARPEWQTRSSAVARDGLCIATVTMTASNLDMLSAQLKYFAKGSPFPIVLQRNDPDTFTFNALVRPARSFGFTQKLVLEFRLPEVVSAAGGETFATRSADRVRWLFPQTGRYRVSVTGRFATIVGSAEDDSLSPPVPAEADLERNICEGEKRSWLWPLDIAWFYQQMRDYGRMDYKRGHRSAAEFGNFNYGAVGAAMGWPTAVLLNEAGRNQMQPGKTYKPEWGTPGPIWAPKLCTKTCGDQPEDRAWILRGINYFNSLDRRTLRQKCNSKPLVARLVRR